MQLYVLTAISRTTAIATEQQWLGNDDNQKPQSRYVCMCVDIIIILGAQNVSNQFKINANAATISLPSTEFAPWPRQHGCIDGDPWANKPGARKSSVAVFQSCRCSGLLPKHPPTHPSICNCHGNTVCSQLSAQTPTNCQIHQNHTIATKQAKLRGGGEASAFTCT